MEGWTGQHKSHTEDTRKSLDHVPNSGNIAPNSDRMMVFAAIACLGQHLDLGRVLEGT